jgi:hypothetical protein
MVRPLSRMGGLVDEVIMVGEPAHGTSIQIRPPSYLFQ